MKKKKCVICAGVIAGRGALGMGHNSLPVSEGVCCDLCNETVVIRSRMLIAMLIQQRIEKATQHKHPGERV
jgi:hypothetical protein